MTCTMDEVAQLAVVGGRGLNEGGASRALDFARAEDEAIWTREWVCVGLSSEIPEAGDLLPYTVGDHAVHIQRMGDGRLVGRFNKAQHGGCRVVPLQCRQGAKTPCSFTSCGHSLDRPVIRAGELDDGTPHMFQYLGLRPERLLPVRTAAFGPLLFVHLEPQGPGFARSEAALAHCVPALAAGDASVMADTMEWVDCEANWKQVAAQLLDSDRKATQPDGPVFSADRAEGEVAVLHFPNLVLMRSADSLCAVVLQPVALARTRCRFALLSGGDGVAWRERLAARLAAAQRTQRQLERCGSADSSAADDRPDARGRWLLQVVLERVRARTTIDEGAIHG